MSEQPKAKRRRDRVRETIVVDGIAWTRYPESPSRNHRVYFSAGIGGKRIMLHRYLWEQVHGPLPDKHEIHHKDCNPINNAIENLECLTKKQHRRVHADLGAFSTPEQLEHLARIRGLTKDWHRSDEGRAWHREHAKTSICSRQPTRQVCTWCGVEFVGLNMGGRRFCSRKCAERERYHRTKKIVPGTCEWCGNAFLGERSGKQRYCSKSCAHTHYWAKRKEASLEPDSERAA